MREHWGTSVSFSQPASVCWGARGPRTCRGGEADVRRVVGRLVWFPLYAHVHVADSSPLVRTGLELYPSQVNVGGSLLK